MRAVCRAKREKNRGVFRGIVSREPRAILLGVFPGQKRHNPPLPFAGGEIWGNAHNPLVSVEQKSSEHPLRFQGQMPCFFSYKGGFARLPVVVALFGAF